VPTVYADRHLKTLIERRAVALSDPDEGEMINECTALADMLAPQYRREYERLQAEHDLNRSDSASSSTHANET